GQSEWVEEFFAMPLASTATIIGTLLGVWTLFVLLDISLGNPTLHWRMISAVIVASLIFAINLTATGERIHFYPTSLLLTGAIFFSLVKLGINAHIIAPLILLPAYSALAANRIVRERASRFGFLSEEFINYSIIIACLTVFGCLFANAE